MTHLSVLFALSVLSCLVPGTLHAQAAPTSLPAPDSPTALGWLILIISAALFVCNQALTLIRFFRQDPPNHTLYATKADLTKLETDLDARIAGMSTASAQSREKVYLALTEIRDAVARLETNATTQAAQIARLDTKLDAVADRASAAKAQADAARHFSP